MSTLTQRGKHDSSSPCSFSGRQYENAKTAQQALSSYPVLSNGQAPHLRRKSRNRQNPAERRVLALSHVD
jgi:hypothetical protein